MNVNRALASHNLRGPGMSNFHQTQKNVRPLSELHVRERLQSNWMVSFVHSRDRCDGVQTEALKTGLEILPQGQLSLMGNTLERNPCWDSLQVCWTAPLFLLLILLFTHPQFQFKTAWWATYLVGQTISQETPFGHPLVTPPSLFWDVSQLLCEIPPNNPHCCNLIKETYKHGVSYVPKQKRNSCGEETLGFETRATFHSWHIVSGRFCVFTLPPGCP